MLGATLMVALVAFSRLALGVHYLSDVVAAFAEGVFWVTLCHLVFDSRPSPGVTTKGGEP